MARLLYTRGSSGNASTSSLAWARSSFPGAAPRPVEWYPAWVSDPEDDEPEGETKCAFFLVFLLLVFPVDPPPPPTRFFFFFLLFVDVVVVVVFFFFTLFFFFLLPVETFFFLLLVVRTRFLLFVLLVVPFVLTFFLRFFTRPSPYFVSSVVTLCERRSVEASKGLGW